ncbi:conserved hypothetical protein, partial [Trichinella spiralis]|uniref:hypothetical protein n=1 Tax=Trichinella spiralis TaxID=6334 RepID=UPI0001EFE487
FCCIQFKVKLDGIGYNSYSAVSQDQSDVPAEKAHSRDILQISKQMNHSVEEKHNLCQVEQLVHAPFVPGLRPKALKVEYFVWIFLFHILPTSTFYPNLGPAWGSGNERHTWHQCCNDWNEHSQIACIAGMPETKMAAKLLQQLTALRAP